MSDKHTNCTIDQLIDEVIEQVDLNLSYPDKYKWVLDNTKHLDNLITRKKVSVR
ncbi:2373_t:CDS:2, partial [Rhizophagus irregularis]